MRRVEDVLYPLLSGTFAFTGMQVVVLFMAHAADSVDETTRLGYLDALRVRLETVVGEAPLDFAADRAAFH